MRTFCAPIALSIAIVAFAFTPAGANDWQRDIFWDYHIDPQGGPLPTGAPGAAYSGPDDPLLWGDDQVLFDGDVNWVATIPDDPGGFGYVGVDYTAPPLGAPGIGPSNLKKKINNRKNNNPLKEIVLTLKTFQTRDMSYTPVVITDTGTSNPDLKTTLDLGQTTLGNDWALIQWHFTLRPNPPSEWIQIHFDLSAGQFLRVKSWRVQTACIPEPGTLIAGAVGLGLLRRRTRR